MQTLENWQLMKHARLTYSTRPLYKCQQSYYSFYSGSRSLFDLFSKRHCYFSPVSFLQRPSENSTGNPPLAAHLR